MSYALQEDDIHPVILTTEEELLCLHLHTASLFMLAENVRFRRLAGKSFHPTLLPVMYLWVAS